MNFYEAHLILAMNNIGPIDKKDYAWLLDLTLCDTIDAFIQKGPTQRLSDILMTVGLFPSRKEFYRKMKAGAILYNDKKLGKDFELDTTIPSFWHEIRFGKKLLEIVVPIQEGK